MNPSGRASCCSAAAKINKMHAAVARQGMTLVPLSIYFNSRGRAKVELAIAKGKKAHDKRDRSRNATGSATSSG